MIDAKAMKGVVDMFHRNYVEWGEDAELLRDIMLRVMHFAAIGNSEMIYRKEVPQTIVTCLRCLSFNVVENNDGTIGVSWR